MSLHWIDKHKIKHLINNKIFLFVLLVVLGLLGNIYIIEVFVGVNQIFGSIFVLLAVWLFGPYLGFLCAIAVHSYTILLWGHPYALINFSIEALVVGMLLRWKISNLFIADLIYWLVLGIWLIPLFYGDLIGLPATQVKLLMLKQSTNGLLNALLASIIAIAIIKTQLINTKYGEYISLKNLLFTIIVSTVVLALYSSGNLISQHILARFQNQATEKLQQTGKHILYEIDNLIKSEVKEINAILVNKRVPKHTQQHVLNLGITHKIQALWLVDDSQLRLLAIQDNSSDTMIKPDVSIFCSDDPQLIPVKKNLFLTMDYKGNCFIASINKKILKDLLINQAYLLHLKILVFNQDEFYTSSLEPQFDSKIVKQYQTGQKQKIKDNIFHLLPTGNMPKIVRWTKSHFIYDLPMKYPSRIKISLILPFEKNMNYLQDLYTYFLSMMMIVMLITALISLFISKLLLRSFEELNALTRDIPDKLKHNKTIQWPISRIEEMRLLTVNFTQLTNSLRLIFQSSEEQYQRLFTGSKEAILVVQIPENVIIDYNPMAEKFIGLNVEDKQIKKITELYPELNHELNHELFDCADNLRQQIYWLQKNDGLIPTRLNVQFLNLNNKNIVLLFIQDISLELKTNQQLNLMASVFDTTSEGIMITDIYSNIILVNRGFSEITGYSSSDVVGNPPQLLHSEVQVKEFYQNLWQEVKKTGKWEGQITNQRKNGESYIEWLSVYQVLNENHKIINFIAVFTDITDKQQIENERKQSQLALQKAKDTAVLANQAKSDFLAKMSHEIRTPMNAIIGLTELLIDKGYSEELLQELQKINHAGNFLLRIINDILDFSKIEAGKLELQATIFSLSELQNHLQVMFTSSVEEKGLQLKFLNFENENKLLWGDIIRIEQVLTNLISNAIKFTEHGDIIVSVHKLQDKNNTVKLKFTVVDSGIGISEKNMPKLFTPFSQGDETITRHYGGTGLGLNISKRLVNLMGGDIWVESQPDRGSHFGFSVLLPKQDKLNNESLKFSQQLLTTNYGSKKAHLQQLQESISGASVLLVEDNAINRQVACEVLQNCGLVVDMVVDGEQAVAAALNNHYDLVLMDIQMPRMDGYSATRKIREKYSPQQLPIIAMTAHALESDTKRSLQEGMNEHITKPIQREKLYNALLHWIPSRKQISPIIKQQTTPNHTIIENPKSKLAGKLPGIDLDDVLTRLGGNEELFYNLILDFKRDYASAGEKLGKLLTADLTSNLTLDLTLNLTTQDRSDACELVHAIKGIAGNMGARKVQIAAKDLEILLSTEVKPKTIQTKLSEMNNVMDELLQSIDSLSATKLVKEHEKTIIDIDLLQAGLEQLSTIVAESDTNALEQFKQLKPGLSHYLGEDKNLNKLTQALENFDFIKAAEVINKIQNTITNIPKQLGNTVLLDNYQV